MYTNIIGNWFHRRGAAEENVFLAAECNLFRSWAYLGSTRRFVSKVERKLAQYMFENWMQDNLGIVHFDIYKYRGES